MKPTVVAITETWTAEKYNIDVDGYTPFPNHRNEWGGGIIILVRKEIKNITTEVKITKEYLESLWIVIDNQRVKIRIGVVYFPQEKDQDLKEIYGIIKEQVREGGNNGENVMIVGDFNC